MKNEFYQDYKERVMPALQKQLITSVTKGLFNFLFVRLHIGDVRVLMPGDPVKITELTIGNANIGGIHIPVDLPGNNSCCIGFLNFTQLIRHIH